MTLRPPRRRGERPPGGKLRSKLRSKVRCFSPLVVNRACSFRRLSLSTVLAQIRRELRGGGMEEGVEEDDETDKEYYTQERRSRKRSREDGW